MCRKELFNFHVLLGFSHFLSISGADQDWPWLFFLAERELNLLGHLE